MTNSFYYPHKRVAKIESLAKLLKTDINCLIETSRIAPHFYKANKPDKSGRITYRVLSNLKEIQKEIKVKLLEKVSYPDFLHANIKKRNIKTNAENHTSSKYIIKEDIKKYFDNCNAIHICNIWKNVFNFSNEISELLTSLTTYNNILPQGTSTSPMLSNLIFWKCEPDLVEYLAQKGFVYTRYVDDISVSSKKKLNSTDKKNIVTLIYGMLHKNGFKPKRSKHKIFNSSGRMLVNEQIVNRNQVSIGKNSDNKHYQENLRAMIHSLTLRKNQLSQTDFCSEVSRINGKIAYVAQYNPNKAQKFRNCLKKLSIGLK